MSVTSSDIDQLHRLFPSQTPPPRFSVKYIESKPDRAVLYRKMVMKEWTDAARPTSDATEGESSFNFRTAFEKYHTGHHARVWTSTEMAKVRGFENAAKGGDDYVLVQFVFKDELTTIFKDDILPQKMTGAQHMNEKVLMHREGYKPFQYGELLVKNFNHVDEVTATIETHRAFDLGFTAMQADKLNTNLLFARIRD